MPPSFKTSVRIVGVDQVRQNLHRYKKEVPKLFARALRIEAVFIMMRSRRIVPLKDGDLLNSSKVLKSVISPGGRVIKVEMTYTSRYAARQHEDLGYRHKSGEQAKYLEAPARAAAPSIPGRMAKRIRTRLRRMSRGR